MSSFMTPEEKKEFKDKLLLGLEKAYEKMLAFKRQKKSKLVIIRNPEIVRVNP